MAQKYEEVLSGVAGQIKNNLPESGDVVAKRLSKPDINDPGFNPDIPVEGEACLVPVEDEAWPDSSSKLSEVGHS
jgi:hypothetical protein